MIDPEALRSKPSAYLERRLAEMNAGPVEELDTEDAAAVCVIEEILRNRERVLRFLNEMDARHDIEMVDLDAEPDWEPDDSNDPGIPRF